MQAGPILLDTSERGWWTRLRYPVAFVQTFTPCHWSDFRSYICEDDYFNDEVFKARIAWLSTSSIQHQIHYDTAEMDLELETPRVYRVWTAFINSSDALAYRLRWK